MTPRIDAADRADVVEVALRCRDRDFAEFEAVNRYEDRQQMARQLATAWRPGSEWMAAFLDDRPVLIGIVREARPFVATLGLFATDECKAVVPLVTRFMRRTLFPALRRAGVHRIEAVSSAEFTEAHRWLEMVGLQREATMRGFGKHGETFLQFAWVEPCLCA